MTAKQREILWYSDQSNLQTLQQLLANPVVVEAIALIKDLKAPALTQATLQNHTVAASICNYQAGVFDAFRALDELTRPSVPREQPNPHSLIPEHTP